MALSEASSMGAASLAASIFCITVGLLFAHDSRPAVLLPVKSVSNICNSAADICAMPGLCMAGCATFRLFSPIHETCQGHVLAGRINVHVGNNLRKGAKEGRIRDGRHCLYNRMFCRAAVIVRPFHLRKVICCQRSWHCPMISRRHGIQAHTKLWMPAELKKG